ncbi:dephospho-CoA kinase [Leptolyngbya sp. AN02str]|uniref:dephospho-CoA kinase n=1 Tax=Leptolyngbya sp. AN02str TaxID=3423363 RepID=UPI003D322296
MMSDRKSSFTMPPRVIGLTGGIGMGKTTVSSYLASAYHVPVLDADVYAREAVEPGAPLLAEIVERYGPGVLVPRTGELDRARLGEIVFASQAELIWLEQRIHPYVRDRIANELQRLATEACPVAVVVVPLLFEARMTDLVTEIWVVRCNAAQQVQRIQERDRDGRLTLEQIHARIESQTPIDEKAKLANAVIDNSSTTSDLYARIDEVLMQHPRPCFR